MDYQGQIHSFSVENILYFKFIGRVNAASRKYNRGLIEEFIKKQNSKFYFIVDVTEWECIITDIESAAKDQQEFDFQRGREKLFLVINDRKIFSSVLKEAFVGNNPGSERIEAVETFENVINELEDLDIDTKPILKEFNQYKSSLKDPKTLHDYMILPSSTSQVHL